MNESPVDVLKLLLVQHAHVAGGTSANLAALEEQIRAETREAHLIVLPEMFATGYTMQANVVAEPVGLHTMKWMQLMAAHMGAVVCGSLPVKENSLYYNRYIAMQPDGSYYFYNKKHLFSFAKESEVFTAGQERLIFNIMGWNICPLICYDLRFPEWSRNKNNEYDLLLYSAAWPQARIKAWELLLPARAVENQAYTIGVNACGIFEETIYGGLSAAYDLKGNCLIKAGVKPGLFYTELPMNELQHFRNKFPVWRDADIHAV